MKNSNSIALIVLLLTFHSFSQESMLSHFGGDVSQGKVLLAWTIKSGSICNGVDIFRSVDDVQYEKIGDIPGVCGEINSPKSYTYTDIDPIKNAINYYRIELGDIETSKSIQVEVLDVAQDDYLIRPHPVVDQSQLIISNDNNHQLELKVFDANGREYYNAETSSNMFIINRQDFKKGLYYFQVIDSSVGSRLTGKISIPE